MLNTINTLNDIAELENMIPLAGQYDFKGHFSSYFTGRFSHLYNYIKDNPLIFSYANNRRYYFYAINGRIYYISEVLLSFLIFLVTYFGTIGIRLLLKRYEVGKKLKKNIKEKFQKTTVKFKKTLNQIKSRKKAPMCEFLDIRGGSQSEVEDLLDLLDYEPSTIDLTKVPFPHLIPQLGVTESLVKGIVKKCLKRDRFYKVTNRGLAEIIEQMVEFKREDTTRIISYKAMILALVAYMNPVTRILHESSTKVIRKLGFSTAILYAPLFVAAFIGFTSGVSLNLANFNFLSNFLISFSTWSYSYRAAEFGRNLLGIDCSDFVQVLPVVDVVDSDLNPTSKISVSVSKPTRHDIFVSTSPNQDLFYEEKLKMDTLDGFYKKSRTANGGSRITWSPTPHVDKVAPINHRPLKTRTRTMSDLRNFDSTNNRESVQKIIDQIQNERMAFEVLDEFLE